MKLTSRRIQRGCLGACLSLLCAWSASFAHAQLLEKNESTVEAPAKAWKVLQERCFRCHGPNDAKSDLRFDLPGVREKFARPGNPIFGEPQQSELLRRVQSDDKSYQMPKDEPRLSDEEIEALTRWISEGTIWPIDVTVPETVSTMEPISVSFFEKYSPQIDYAVSINELLRFLYLPALLFFVLILVTERWRRNSLKAATVNSLPFWKEFWLHHFTRTQYFVVTFIFLFAGTVRLYQARVGDLQSQVATLRSDFDNLTGGLEISDEEKADGPPIYRPKHPPRLGGVYYRGNDERNPELFNGGYYRTAVMDVALLNANGEKLEWNDETAAGDLFVRIVITRAPLATPSLFQEDAMQACVLTQKSLGGETSENGPPAMAKDVQFKTVVKDEQWEASCKIGTAETDGVHHLAGRLYLGPGNSSSPHYGIEYDIEVREGRISEQSELWMGSIYLTGSVVVPKPDSIPLSEWFDFLPIPEITRENSKDPKLLGIEPN